MSSNDSLLNGEKRISFLFGAGISVAVGMPTTNEITKEIISDDRFKKTDKKSFLENTDGTHMVINEPFSREVNEFIIKLYDFIQENNTTDDIAFKNTREFRHQVNYEDLVFLLYSMHDHLSKNYNLFGKILCDKMFGNKQNNNNREIIEDVNDFIHKTLASMLRERERETQSDKINKQLNTIKCALKENRNSAVFTLNHDSILERLLKINDIQYIDGFGEIDGELRKWDSSLLEKNDGNKLKILKLHGSINWSEFEEIDNQKEIRAIYTGNVDIENEYAIILDSLNRKFKLKVNSLPLIGSENKIRSYLFGIYSDLQRNFINYLVFTDVLVVFGYSFGDTIINNRILEWLINGEAKGMIVIDNKDVFTFFNQAKSEIMDTYWHGLEQSKKLIYQQSGIENIRWEEIKELIAELNTGKP
jgi:NAD-dependent SIR2 family protein deacetylase